MYRSCGSVFKIVLVGGEDVGKTALVQRFLRDDFWDHYDPTMEVSSSPTREIPISDTNDSTLQLSLYDTPGHSRFEDACNTLCLTSYTDGVAVIFDVTNHESFRVAKKKISLLVGKYLILIGTKSDMVSDGDLGKLREVSEEEAASVAHGGNCPYIEVSAATGVNVELAFQRLASDIRKRVHVKPGRH